MRTITIRYNVLLLTSQVDRNNLFIRNHYVIMRHVIFIGVRACLQSSSWIWERIEDLKRDTGICGPAFGRCIAGVWPDHGTCFVAVTFWQRQPH